MTTSSNRPPRRSRRALLVAVPILAVGGVAFWRTHERDDLPTSGVDADAAVQEIPTDDREAPLSLSGPALNPQATGDRVDVADHRGSVVVVNVWGSWCAPCRAEAPVLRDNAAKYAAQGVQFVGVNVKDSPAAARAFERSYDIAYPSIDDSVEGRAFLDLRGVVPAAAIPSTVVLDRQGRVAARVIGQIGDVTLRTLLDSVLAEAEPVEGGSIAGDGSRSSPGSAT